MACLKVMSVRGLRVIPEAPDGNCYGKLLDEVIVGVDFNCAGNPVDDLNSIFTDEGLMIGNLVKKVTTAIGIKQCLSCRGRQQRLNLKGLELQRKLGL